MAEAEDQYRQNLAAFERARYEARRAQRQYDAVEPEARLVARTLERTWDDKLAAVRQAENDLRTQQARRPVPLTSEELGWMTTASADVKAVFWAPTTTILECKQLIRGVIAEVVLTIDDQQHVAGLRIIWQGGAVTEPAMPMTKKGGHTRTTSEDTVALVRRLAAHYDDKTIAQILAKQWRRTGTGLTWTKTGVKTLRVSRDIPAFQPQPEHVSTGSDDNVLVTVPQVAVRLGISKYAIDWWLREGFITGEQLTPGAPWHIRLDQALRDKLRPQVPDGWLPLDQAAAALGIACQTVLYKVHRGELNAVLVNRGQRHGLRIQVKHDQA